MSAGGGHDLLTGPGGHTFNKPGTGGGGAGVAGITAADATIVIGGTAANPTVATGTLTPGSNGTIALGGTAGADVTLSAGAAGAGATAAKIDHTHALSQAIAPTWTGAHIWETGDNGTTSVPVQATVQHRNNAAGTPAAGYGTGLLFKLDSAARTLRSAVELDAVWSTATDGSEVSALAVKTMLAGALTEVARFGTGATLPDSDFSFSFGRCLFDSRATDGLYMSHRDMTSTSQYAVRQTAAGTTFLNAASGQSCSMNVNIVKRVEANATGIGFFNTAPVAQSTGWAAITNPAVRKTFDTTTVTLPQLAEFVGTLSEYIKSLGLIST
jgi:hypothetical protein